MDITYKLPHPVRMKCSEFAEMELQAQDRIYSQVFDPEEVKSYSSDHLVALLQHRAPGLFDYYRRTAKTDHDALITMSSTIAPYRFRTQEGNIITTSTLIDRLLEQVDIGDDIPIAYLRPPFKHCYIEFTEDRSSSIMLYNEETHEHILEGVYISETEVQPETEIMEFYKGNPTVDPLKPLRILDLMFTGSPLGKSHNADDALRIQGFYIQDDNMLTINDELRRVESLYGNDVDFSGDMNYLSMALNHMAKVLLFINCRQYRDTAFNERKDLLKRIESLKSPAKIRKYESKLRKTYDRIIIKPVDNVVYERGAEHESAENQPLKRAHWRKGHFRMQPYGVGASKRKVIFIEPTVVGGIFANKKSYDVRTK
ncbi:hypothetical protein [Pseudomonas sp. PIC25]|uniref:hypothetical protein n=1 Tax=Pseudomonas sp. PIC25 TaxID=1958773 RepID=UPI00117B67A6|nr:hypothetical protein [Pseudomonas sp. PIC25]